MIDDALTEKIIGCAFKVYNVLGAGFLESVYKRALGIELAKAGLAHAVESPIVVDYEGTAVGSFCADIIVGGKVILELKAVDELNKIHEVQLVNYLQATGIPIGLLINFGPQGVRVKRKFRDFAPKKES